VWAEFYGLAVTERRRKKRRDDWSMDNRTSAPQPTIEELLGVAMELEEHSRRFYDGLAERFAHVPEVAAFWRQFAAAEAGHKKALENLRASLHRLKVTKPVDPAMLAAGRKLLAVSAEQLLEPVTNLDEAYELANELEASETNRIFEFLIRELAGQPSVLEFMSTNLREHVERLWNAFPAPYRSREDRQRVTTGR
jgi:rubrerythrin